MRWRVMVELTGSDGCVSEAILAAGERVGPGHAAATLGLTLTESKAMVAASRQLAVRAQVSEHCDFRRRCASCGALRPVKDRRARTLITACGVVSLRAPRFSRCRCGVACQRSITPVAEIMPDRRAPDHERIPALMGGSLPYRQARSLLSGFPPLTGAPDVETVRQRTLKAGARLERAASAAPESAPSTPAGEIVLSIDGGRVRSVKACQQRSFEAHLTQIVALQARQSAPRSAAGFRSRSAS